MLTACVPAPAVTATPELAAVPTPTATLLPAPSPILEVQMPWQVPDERYDNSPWWQGTPCFYGEPMMELIPAPDYGEIYPYVGGMTSGDRWWPTPIFGLSTIDGQIITVPRYGTMFYLFDGENEAYLLYDNNGRKHAPYDRPCVLVATDGSWLLEFESVHFHEAEYGNERDFVDVGYLAVKQNGFWGIVGYDGQVIEPFAHSSPEQFYQSNWIDDDHHWWSWLGGTAYSEDWYDEEIYEFRTIIHIGQTQLEDGYARVFGDIVSVRRWVAKEVLVPYDRNGNHIGEGETEIYEYRPVFDRVRENLYFDQEGNLLPDVEMEDHSIYDWVNYEWGEETGLFTTYLPNGELLLTVAHMPPLED